jgi:Ca-activated chloride channel family protein
VQQHRGARDFVRNKEKIEAKVDALCQKIAQPALTDVEVRCDGLDAADVHPARTRDLFCGEMLQVVGRYRNSGKQKVRVTGKQNGVAREFVFEVDFPAVATQHTFVQTLWARQHIATLLDAIRRHGQKPELVEEVKRLATQYGIVTRYTSQLIVEEGMRLAGDQRPYRGPGDVTAPAPSSPGGASAGLIRPTAMGPATGGGAAPGSPGAVPMDRSKLADLGRTRTGAEAVEQSLETSDDFYLGSKRRTETKKERGGAPDLVRRAAGRVFMPVGDDFVEQGLPADWVKQVVVIEAFGDAYFELLRQKPQLRDILALGHRVVFRDGERIVHVQPAAPKAVVAEEPASVK